MFIRNANLDHINTVTTLLLYTQNMKCLTVSTQHVSAI